MKGNKKALETKKKILEGLRTGISSPLTHILILVSNLSTKVTKIAVQELADLVKNDVVVLEKVLRVSNTFGYNPTRKQIYTLNEAIQVIGFERLRRISLSLLLLQNAQEGEIVQERLNENMKALLSGLLAESLAEENNFSCGETVFLAASLRGFARLLLANFFLQELKKADQLSRVKNEDVAFYEVFGLDPTELNQWLFRKRNLSPEILFALQKCPVDLQQLKKDLLEHRLLVLSDFCYSLATATLNPFYGEIQYKKLLSNYTDRLKSFFLKKEIQIYSHLSKANSQIKQFVKELGKSKLPTNWLHCLESRLNHYDPESHILTSNSRKFERITLEDFLHEKFELSKEAELLQRFTEVGLENLDLARKFLINFCNLNFKTDAVLLYQRKINSDVYELIEGGGSAAGIPRGWEKFKKEENVIFRLALRHREVLILDDLSPKRIQQHLPPILRNEFITNSMTLVSVRDELSEIGLFLLLWQKPGAASQHREKIGLLKNLLSIYTALHRGSEH